MKGLLCCTLIVLLVLVWDCCESKMPKGYKECQIRKYPGKKWNRFERGEERSLDSGLDNDEENDDDEEQSVTERKRGGKKKRNKLTSVWCTEDGGCPKNCTCLRKKHVCVPKNLK
uniref:Evasin n=1 Tax=Rhipicephalus zambeziensis TaxID=60191 RepID=A0A224Y9E1_9ACAR